MARRTDIEANKANEEAAATNKGSLLIPSYTGATLANPTIAHHQLRHLLACPIRRGIVYSVTNAQILEHNVLQPESNARCMVRLDFKPTSFATTAIASIPNTVLIAAGGSRSDLHLSLHSFPAQATGEPSKPIWKHDIQPNSEDIVNALVFIPSSVTDDSRGPKSELRLITCINNMSVCFYDIYVQANVKTSERMRKCGKLVTETFVNHVSISPDGRTLLCVGDTPLVYLYHIIPGHRLTFTHIVSYTLPPPPRSLQDTSIIPIPADFGSRACFASSWSSDGYKFAVGSQEGQLCVWDVRSAKPVFTYWTPLRANSRSRDGRTWGDSGLLFDREGNAPDSGIRQVRFTTGENGRELLLWTEHTLNLHVIDGRTFDMQTHCMIPMPNLSELTGRVTTTPEAMQVDATPSPSGSRSISPTPAEEDSEAPSAVQEGDSPSTSAIVSPSSPVLVAGDPDPASSYTTQNAASDGSTVPAPNSSALAPPSPYAALSTSPPAIGPSSPSPNPSAPRVLILPANHVGAASPHFMTRSRASSWIPSPIAAEAERERLFEEHALFQQMGDLLPQAFVVQARRGNAGARLTRPMMLPPGVAGEEIGISANEFRPLPMGGDSDPVSIAGMCLDPTNGWVYVASSIGIVEWRVREREEGKAGGVGAWR